MKGLIGLIGIGIGLRIGLIEVEAANVANGMIIFTESSSCPTGFTEIDTTKRGRAILSDPGSGPYGTLVGTSLTNGQVATHSHEVGSLCVSAAIPEIATGLYLSGLMSTMAPHSAGTICDSDAQSADTAKSSGYAFAQLRTCVATSSTAQVPANTVAQFDSSVSSCPTGWSSYTAANGRFIIPLDASRQATFTTVTSTASAMTVGDSSSATGTHSHTLSTTLTFSAYGMATCCSDGPHYSHGDVYNGGSSNYAWPVTGATKSKNALQNEVPWVSLLTCYATTGVTKSGNTDPRLPQGSLVFMALSACPVGYTRANSNSASRLR